MSDYTAQIQRFIRELSRKRVNMHSILLTVDGETIYESYTPPFRADKPHRMYSETKSFVSMAIGCLIAEGKLNLDDRIADFFRDKLPENPAPELMEQTVRDMLMMNTCLAGVNWFKPEVTDRCACYFAQKPVRPAGTLFNYDSTGTYVLGVLVERLSGMKLLDYMKLKFLDEIGEFENAHILSCMDGTPWGDSALVATSRALERFGRLLMNKGEWNGKQLIPRDYVETATSRLTDTAQSNNRGYDYNGYGYQIWRCYNNTFALYGMGGQFTVVMPDKKLVFVCTGDNQFYAASANATFDALFDCFNPEEQTEVCYKGLPVVEGAAHSAFEAEINGARFICGENRMGIEWFSLSFENEGGVLEYKNAQGIKKLPFGMGSNRFGYFPELGYSDEYGNRHDITDFKYEDAVSAAWVTDRHLRIFVQIIDRYLGSCVMNFGFRDGNTCGIRMIKNAEDFLGTYEGWAGARRA